MQTTRQTVSTSSADNMPLTGNNVTHLQPADVTAQLNNFTRKFMATDHGHGNRFLGPFIPVVNMDVGATNRCFVDLDQNVIATNFRNWHVFQPKTFLGTLFY